MLVLARRPDESVYLEIMGVKIRVMVVRVEHGDKVKIGFDAPAEVNIYREECGPKGGPGDGK